MFIGLTGENCSGKGTVAEYLGKKSFYYISLSDVIREELAAEGIEITRDNLVKKANKLREEFGPAILAKKTIAKLEKDRNYVIDSIRNPAEAEELKKLKNFFLVYTTAPEEIRFERMKTRGRENDPRTFEAFKKLEELESKNKEGYKQNLYETGKMANKTIENHGSFTELYDRIDIILSEFSNEFKMDRPTWDEYFMNIAKQVATRSNCVKRKVAAIIIKDKRIISTGYNGTPRGTKNCNEGGCPRCNNFSDSGKNLDECLCAHGEENAIVQAAYHGISINGGILYTTFSPCLYCSRMIINSGIKEVVYNSKYPMSETPFKLLKEAGVIVRAIDEK
ncbi:MAG: deaminase [Candidatus Micrarchaeia archaeon]